MSKKIGMLGSGAYGLSLTCLLCDNDNDITLWNKFEKEKEKLENSDILAKNNIKKSVKVTTDLEEAVKDKDLIIIAIPSSFVEDLILQISPYIDNHNIIIATKGINDNGEYLSSLVTKYLNTSNIAIISGGSFAKDIITKNDFALTVAYTNEDIKNIIIECFKTDYLHLDYTDDLEGVEFCGTYKNIIAIATGILEGVNAPESTRKYFLFKAIVELQELLSKLGKKETLISSAGICDLMLTATSKDSRNYTFGTLLGVNKEKAQEYLNNTTVEGINNLKAMQLLLENKSIKSTLLDNVYNVIHKNEDYKNLLK